MHYTKIYSDEQGESHFEVVKVPVSPHGIVGTLSEKFLVKSMQFRENTADYDWDYHNAPQRQFIILLAGKITGLLDEAPGKIPDTLSGASTTI